MKHKEEINGIGTVSHYFFLFNLLDYFSSKQNINITFALEGLTTNP